MARRRCDSTVDGATVVGSVFCVRRFDWVAGRFYREEGRLDGDSGRPSARISESVVGESRIRRTDLGYAHVGVAEVELVKGTYCRYRNSRCFGRKSKAR